jgi:biopolymer transport protein ExbD
MKVASAAGKGTYHIQAEINMIPLIDVALVLLIIFMVISPILVQSQLRVNLPKVSSSSTAEETALKVEVAPDGTLAFDGKIVTREELRQRLMASLPPGNKASLLIEADQDVPFQNVVYVMDLAKQFKVEKLGVSVLPQIQR